MTTTDRRCFRCRQSGGPLYEAPAGVVSCLRHLRDVPAPEPRREAAEPKPGWPVGKAGGGGAEPTQPGAKR